MKLRNKKTGEIGRLITHDWLENKLIISDDDGVQLAKYNSLAELNAEWEDYEEPKEWYYIDISGVVKQGEDNVPTHLIEGMGQIGNYFETEEEAEEAVEKLKAFKRLKDKGFKFTGYNACSVDYDIDEQYRKYISEDLDLLFGGEK